VGTYKNKFEALHYDPKLAWTGDQGLIAGGLISLREITDQSSPSYQKAAFIRGRS